MFSNVDNNMSQEGQEKEMEKKDKEKERIVPFRLWGWISTCRKKSLHFFLRHIFFWIRRLHSFALLFRPEPAGGRTQWYLASKGEVGAEGQGHFCSAVAGC